MKKAVEICQWNESEKSSFVKNNKDLESIFMGNPNRELSDVELLNRDYYQGRLQVKA